MHLIRPFAALRPAAAASGKACPPWATWVVEAITTC